jgi:hypothetical protein
MNTPEAGMPQPDNKRFLDNAPRVETHKLCNGQRLEFYQDVPPIISKSDAIAEQGINGDILAVIELPPDDDAHGKAKRIAIVDFGPGAEDPEGVPVALLHDEPVWYMGVASNRFGLFGMNYSPTTHLSPYVPLTDKPAVLGTNSEHASYFMGLSVNDPTAESSLSLAHVSIEVIEDRIVIEDSSELGTTVYTAY